MRQVEIADDDARVPVNVLTGFLGSGKTTLLKRLLTEPALSNSAIIINELGEIPIDHHLIEYVDQEVLVLKNGCVCCGMREDLRSTLEDVVTKHWREDRERPARVIIETTGMADPVPILNTLALDAMLRHQFRVGTVVTTIDAHHGERQLDEHPEAVRQVAVADRLVITKMDLVAPDALEKLRLTVTQLNGSAPCLTSANDLDPAQLALDHDSISVWRALEAKRWFSGLGSRSDSYHGMSRANSDDSPRISGQLRKVRTASLVLDGPLNWVVFGCWLSMLVHRYGDGLLRMKGLLCIEGSDQPAVVHGVHRLIHAPVHLEAWPDEDRRSRIVLIGDVPPEAELQESLERFLSWR